MQLNDNRTFIKEVEMKVQPSIQFKRGDFITYYEPVVKANVVINVQDWYWDKSLYDPGKVLSYKKWIYYKAYNLSNKFLYHDGSRLAIILEDYPDARYSKPDEISAYLEALKREGLTI